MILILRSWFDGNIRHHSTHRPKTRLHDVRPNSDFVWPFLIHQDTLSLHLKKLLRALQVHSHLEWAWKEAHFPLQLFTQLCYGHTNSHIFGSHLHALILGIAILVHIHSQLFSIGSSTMKIGGFYWISEYLSSCIRCTAELRLAALMEWFR